MGNKLGRRRQVVDEKYTRPQGLYQHRDVDHKKLRKLILDSKLAPCYPGGDEYNVDLEECPICFLYYPSLNRSRCCMKGICTECFLQMKPHHSTRPTQCPFCKTSNYAVEYRGMRTQEEKGMEQVEEQRVIEARIRLEQHERQDDEERMQKRRDMSASSRIMTPREFEYEVPLPSVRYKLQGDEFQTSPGSRALPAIRRASNSRLNRVDELDLDLEDMMVMEAIWLSIQDHGSQKGLASHGIVLSEPSSSDSYASQAMTPLNASPSGGLASAVASLAECQHMNGDSTSVSGVNCSTFGVLAQSNGETAAGVSREDCEWTVEHESEVAEAGTSYASSDVAFDAGARFHPESFEEQMMMATAVSLAEARTRSNTQGMTWL